MSRRALVTGATGFIGGKLARRLAADGWTVHLLLRGSGKSGIAGAHGHRYSGDTAQIMAAVDQAQPDIVFHLASLYLADHRADQVADLVSSNILLTAQLGEAIAARGGGRLINTGTGWQHLDGREYHPVNLYAATKQAGADLLRYHHEARALSVSTLKLFDTYGVGDTRRKLVQLLVDAANSGEVLAMSSGEQWVDMTHVDDVVDAFIIAAARLMDAPAPVWETAFVTGERFRVRDLVAVVGETLGRPVHARLGGRPYRDREVMMPYPPKDAERLPGWAPTRTVRGTLPDLAVGAAENRP